MALVAVPTVVAVVLGVVGLTGAVSSANAYGRAATLARLANQVTTTGVAIDDEQDVTAAFVAAGRPPQLSPSVATAQQRTDQATAALRSGVAQVGDSYPQSTRDRAGRAVFRLDALPALRAAATTSRLPALVVVDQYSTINDDLVAVDDEIAQESADASLSASVRALGALSRARSVLADERALVRAALITGTFEPGSRQTLVDADAARNGYVSQFRTAADLSLSQRYDEVVAGAPVDDTAARIDGLIRADGPGVPVGGPPAADAWDQAASGTLARLHTVESELVGQVVDRASALRSSQITRAVVAGIIALAVLLIALLATLVVVRSLTRPLRALRRGAGDVAEERLPAMVGRLSREDPEQVDTHVDPIAVDSAYEFGADEIGEVARSFDDVHREAVRLAAAEARRRAQTGALVVNLSRRTQSLVERQLELIDDLERTEEDPERLGELFRLDHLATRMRRNGENLLVLGGEEPLRRWNRVMALLDVLRAAVSEVEQYTRVELAAVPEIWVGEDAVSDLVHLFAELVENATAFSARSTAVTIETTLLPDRSILVEITDQGIGLDPQEYERLNERLARGGDDALGSEVSRRMGLVVVARLAARRGVTVRLRPGTVGVVARVSLPGAVLADRVGTPARSDQSSPERQGAQRRDSERPAAAAITEPATDELTVVGAGDSGGDAGGGSWLGQRWSNAVTTPGPGPASWFGGAPLAGAAAGAGLAAGAAATAGGSGDGDDRGDRGEDDEGGRHRILDGEEHGEEQGAFGPSSFTPTASGTTTSGLPQRSPGANQVPGAQAAPVVPAADTGSPFPTGPTGPASAEPSAPAWDRGPAAVRRRYAGMQRGRSQGLEQNAPDAERRTPEQTPEQEQQPVEPGPGGVAGPALHPTAAGTTTSGLPQRHPGDNYVPGAAPDLDTSAGLGADGNGNGNGAHGFSSTGGLGGFGEGNLGDGAPGGPTWDRSADAIRRRYAAHQQGRQRAREAGRS